MTLQTNYEIDSRPAQAFFQVDPVTGAAASGGAVTIADNADVAQGAKADATYTTGSGSVISILKGIFTRLTQAAGDAIAATALHAQGAYGFNGAAWDRLRTKGTGWQGVVLVNSGGSELYSSTPADSMTNANTPLNTLTYNELHNGTSWDRQRNNAESTVLASAARTTLTNSPDQINYNGRTQLIYINVSAYTAGGLTVKYQEKEPISGTYIDVLTAAKITGVTAVPVALQIGPNIAAVANLIAQRYPARTWRVVCTPDDATSITYSVSAVTGV